MTNPMQMISGYMNMINRNPLLKNAMILAKQGKTAELEQMARNLMATQGRDFDSEFERFKRQI